MSVRRKWTGWILGVGGILVLAGAGVAAQMSMFSSGLESPLSVASSDALPILVLADVGSYKPPYTPDNNLDLITADQSGKAWVYFGNGDGTFGNNFSISLGRTPTALALGDFDGDKIPDLAITDMSGNLVLLHGNGDGTFSPLGPAVAVGAAPVALAAVDVNDDGKLDIVVVNSSESTGGVTVLLGDGNGGFTGYCSVSTSMPCATNGNCPNTETCTLGRSFPLPPGGSAIGVGDFGNGNVDLAIANGYTNSVFIFQGDGNGNFSALPDISEEPNGGQPVAIAVGDLNKDGHLDIVVANQATDNIGVFLGQPDGTFQLQGLFASGTANSSPNGVALLDANGDGKLDVAVSNRLSFDVSVLLGDGTGNFGAPRAFVTDQEPLTVAARDLNGDGIPDLVALNRDNSTADAVVLLGQGDGSFIGVEDVIVDPTPNAVIGGDTDNDGLADLIVAHPTGTLLVRRAQPSGGFAAPLTLQAAGDAVAIGCGDFNADGWLDIVALNKSTSNVSMFLGQRNGFPSTPQNFSVAGGVALTVGDWDRNGRPDLAVASQGDSSGTINILLSNADGSLQEQPPVALDVNPVAIDWGDFNKDGKLDLAVVSNPAKVTIALGNGDGTFQPPTDVSASIGGNDARTLAVADFDGDGFDDIAVLLATPDNKVVVLYGSGGMNFTAGGQLNFSGNNVWGMAARDVTGDLLPDLLISVQGAGVNAVYAFASQGASRAFDAVANVPVNRSPTSIIAADFDGDGRYDVATTASNIAGTVSVLTNIGATPSIIRGDANGDGKVTAADLLAVARKLRDGAATRVEQAGNGSYHVKPGADANGDGLVTAQDVQALTHRLFPRI
ncbi:MAG: FG-GAP-like repeat-containing protein [Candidatus Binatia bacterium]